MKKFLKYTLIAVITMLMSVTSYHQAEAQESVVVVKKNKRAKKKRIRRRQTRRVVRRVSRRAHRRYAHLPRRGAVIRVLPKGSAVIQFRGRPYNYHAGIFYVREGGNFIVTRPPIGLSVRVLPTASRIIVVKNRKYHYYYGSFYKFNNGVYTITNAPVAAIVDALPEGYEIQEIDGREVYVLDGVKYEEVESDEFEEGVGYRVVS